MRNTSTRKCSLPSRASYVKRVSRRRTADLFAADSEAREIARHPKVWPEAEEHAEDGK